MIGAALRRYAESGQVCEPLAAQPAAVETREEQQPAADLHASSKAVKIEAPETLAETVPPIAAAELSAEPSVVAAADSGENDDTAATTQSTQ